MQPADVECFVREVKASSSWRAETLWYSLTEQDTQRLVEACEVDVSTLAVSESFVFCSSAGESHGRDAFFAAIAAVQARVPPGAVLVRSTPIEEHHGRARFGWRFEDPATGKSFDEQPFGVFLRGMDFATLDDDGRLASLTVFVDAGLAETTQAT